MSTSLAEARKQVQDCKACDLWKNATQAIFGEGQSTADLMLIGEQPGNSEDLAGRPFVGPAGKVLDAALVEAEIDRQRVYITNVVKHFSFVQRGKVRIHKRPNTAQVRACRPWLDLELAAIQPKVLVCLGATAAQALIAPNFRITQQRGVLMKSALGIPVAATAHPSSILRMPDHEARRVAHQLLVDDLRKIAASLKAA
jgi:uracil-DNA glycosylase family protein